MAPMSRRKPLAAAAVTAGCAVALLGCGESGSPTPAPSGPTPAPTAPGPAPPGPAPPAPPPSQPDGSVKCESIFPACQGHEGSGDTECWVQDGSAAAKYPQCNAALQKAFQEFDTASKAENYDGMLEYVLGGFAGSLLRKTTCLTGLRHLHTSIDSSVCPMPLPPLQPTLNAKGSSFNLMTVGDWGPSKVGVKCKCGPECSGSMWIYRPASQCPKVHSHDWDMYEGAQQNVADAMAKFAQDNSPTAVINVGDNFYFGGVPVPGGFADGFTAMTADFAFNHSWREVYINNENDKAGVMKTAPWLSIMGNHDYGGAGCLADWQAQVEFTEADPAKVWKMPYQYFATRVQADGYFIDIFMNDVNHNDVGGSPDHSICQQHLCPPNGKKGIQKNCENRMGRIKDRNLEWLDTMLAKSTKEGARWQIVVGHFIDQSNMESVQHLMRKHGSQLYVGGHTHAQAYYPNGPTSVQGVPVLLTGAGGGIGLSGGNYFGFGNLHITKDAINVHTYDDKGNPREDGTINHPSLASSSAKRDDADVASDATYVV
eukprot:TRINITY_DN4525_c0_g1_i1.p1 TRINITY_DN4525_c0_g1~~TRINITY_DN4525_c0_g1_i1.p1  ORF type:complete len:542 (+),score=116.80 TRINITY_DN4525_c0_g1_i1:106-1731(+)